MIDREKLARALMFRQVQGRGADTLREDLAPILDELEAGRRYKRAEQQCGPVYEERRDWFKAMQATDAHLERLGVIE